MNELAQNTSQITAPKLQQLKTILFISTGIFLVRYFLLIISTIWSDFFAVQKIPVLFICQLVLALIAFAMLCYGLLGIKEYFAKNSYKRVMKGVVYTLLTMIILLLVIIATWSLLGLTQTPNISYDLWIELILIAMPFTELIPLTIAMLYLSYNFWLLRKIDGWKTRFLITPFLLLPLTIIRILAAVFKVINILNPTMYAYAWNMADNSRIISAVLGIFLFIEIFLNIRRIKPKVIVQSN